VVVHNVQRAHSSPIAAAAATTDSRNYQEISAREEKKTKRKAKEKEKNETEKRNREPIPPPQTRPPGLAQLERKRNLFLILICIRNGGAVRENSTDSFFFSNRRER